MNREPSEREIAHVWTYARRLGFDLVTMDDKRFAIADRLTGAGRYPDSGGVTFDEILLVLRRRAAGEW
jgi:hypothetical protein